MNNRLLNGNSEKQFFMLFSAFDAAPIGLLIAKDDLSIVFVNQKMHREFGLAEQIDGLMTCNHLPDTAPTNFCFLGDKKSDCTNCAIQSSLKKLLYDGDSVTDVIFNHSVAETAQENKWYHINGNLFLYNNEKYAVLSFADITQYKDHVGRLLQKLDLDMSTNTLNKHSLLQKINALVSNGYDRSFTICMMDFDWFKEINDQHGHIMGDNVLGTFSSISRKNVRANDVIGRYGGEEFIFIFPEAGLKEAVGIMTRIQKDLKAHFASLLPYPVSFSAGMMYVDKSDDKPLTGSELIGQVDNLLYQAKAQGKNRIVTRKEVFPFV